MSAFQLAPPPADFDVEPSQWIFFWKGPFSQWHMSNFKLWGKKFACAEQAMMYAKANLFGDGNIAGEILRADEPGRQKALGRKVRGFDDAIWDAERVRIVAEVNLAKFEQNRGLRRRLLNTGQQPMAEASPLDFIWGIGLDATNASQTPSDQWPGKNLLGRILMGVRTVIRDAHPDEITAQGPTGTMKEESS
ncbi:NADAR family protein [Roseobacter sp. HKCCA0434]|uniref:NADAR family protein n=1 Tax=Roseobacter sp. HKCCA0434 TaxID=3079297 RepID=UPI002905E7A0|nr:NADAR family protein [Roseobacter sp. HKCCA0434]